MIRKLCLVALVGTIFAWAGASSAVAGDHDWSLKIAWNDNYVPRHPCPGSPCRPWNPFLAVPLHSGFGMTGPRKLIMYPPHYPSPLYNNSPRLVRNPNPQNCPCPW